jgi:hypothetical protein
LQNSARRRQHAMECADFGQTVGRVARHCPPGLATS